MAKIIGIITIIGLSFNLWGAILLLKAGVICKYDKDLSSLKVTETNENSSKWGLTFLLVGFAIQLVGCVFGLLN